MAIIALIFGDVSQRVAVIATRLKVVELHGSPRNTALEMASSAVVKSSKSLLFNCERDVAALTVIEQGIICAISTSRNVRTQFVIEYLYS